ncbi:MAG: ParB/RepB/Spo0J family partition protein [Methanosarcinaceae archaeon]|nr:ParB/RepB/Spo0J family partition protein [Methanosarcinaceae archaeon]
MQKNKKSGLPESFGMRHDDHFVDLIATRTTGPQIRMINLDKIYPNPQNARTEIGDITELTQSIKEKGVLEPILIRTKNGRYEIIAGERRFRASKKAGLSNIPCIEMNVKDNEAMEIALIENLQRKDLDVFEEADGLKLLVEMYGYNHQKISEKIGKARSTITEIINISRIPMEIRRLCHEFGIKSRSTLIEIAKQKDKDDMMQLFYAIRDRDLRREDTRNLSKVIKGQPVRKIKRFVYNFKPEGSDSYRLRLEFKQEKVTKTEVIAILEDILKQIKD